MYYGECKFVDPLTGRKCGCQRLSVTGNIQDNLCRCSHHECYHELLHPYPPYNTFGYPEYSGHLGYPGYPEYHGYPGYSGYPEVAGPFIPYNIDEMVNQIPLNTSNTSNNFGKRQRKAFTCICLLYENSNTVLTIPRK
jgi:hypothetical protein